MAYLNSYEKAVTSLTDSYEKAAGRTGNTWVADLASVQAVFARQLTKVYVDATRELVS
jgi:hypothetical protein